MVESDDKIFFKPAAADGALTAPASEVVLPDMDEDDDRTVLDGKYELLEWVGAGAMASVFSGRHIATNRKVAIKVLSDADSDDLHFRLKQEAKAILSIRHPNVVAAYDFGTLITGESYMVMEFVDGTTLDKVIAAQTKLESAEAAGIALQIASGVAEAHRAGILHRDLKPSNIMLTGAEGSYSVRVVDFGLTKSMSGASEVSLTQTGQVIGTPIYMSPEQCSGLTLDARSDLYSLGCVMYEMLTGEPPFVADNTLRVLGMHVNETPRRFSEFKGVKADPALEAIVFKLLEKDKDKRFATAGELIDTLEQYQRRHSGRTNGIVAAVGNAWDRILLEVGMRGRSRFAGQSQDYRLLLAALCVGAVLTASVVALYMNSDKVWLNLIYRGQRAFDAGKYNEAYTELSGADLLTDLLPVRKKEDRKLLVLGTMCDLQNARGKSESAAQLQDHIDRLQSVQLRDQQQNVDTLIERLQNETEKIQSGKTVLNDATKDLLANLCTRSLDTYVTGWSATGVKHYWQLLKHTEALILASFGENSGLMARCLQDEGDYIETFRTRDPDGTAFQIPEGGSRRCFDAASSIYEHPVAGVDDIDRADSLILLSKAFFRLATRSDVHSDQFARDVHRSLEMVNAAKRIYLKEPVQYDPHVARAQAMTARIYMLMHDWVAAKEPLDEAEITYRHSEPSNLTDKLSFETARAEYFAKAQNQLSAAKQAWQALLEYLERKGEPGRAEMDVNDTLVRLADAQAAANDYGRDLDHCLARAVPMQKRLFPWDTGRRYFLLKLRASNHYILATKAKTADEFRREAAAARADLETNVPLRNRYESDEQSMNKQLLDLAFMRCLTGDPLHALRLYELAYASARPEHKSFAAVATEQLLATVADLTRVGLKQEAGRIIDTSREVIEKDVALTAGDKKALQEQVNAAARKAGL